jgi:hypothetical protein
MQRLSPLLKIAKAMEEKKRSRMRSIRPEEPRLDAAKERATGLEPATASLGS